MNLLVHLVDHSMKLLLLLIDFDLGAIKDHIATLDGGKLGSAHGALKFCLTPFIDAGKAKLMATSVDLCHIFLAQANTALKN